MDTSNAISEKELRTVDEGLASVDAAARFLSLSRAKVYDLMAQGEIGFAKLGRSRRIPWAMLKAYAASALVSAR